MMMQDTLRKLHAMKLTGMAKAYEDQQANGAVLHLSFEERLGLLVDYESTSRDNRRLARLLQSAKLREAACIEDINYQIPRGLVKSELATLTQCDWIDRGINLIITGSTGIGKTWMACAFGNQACRLGKTVLFHRLSLLLEELAISHADGSFRKKLAQIAKLELLILDDLGTGTLNATSRSDLLEVIEQRSGRRATIITSQHPVKNWHDYLSGGNQAVSDAILDRLISGSHRIEMHGDSMRKLPRNPKT